MRACLSGCTAPSGTGAPGLRLCASFPGGPGMGSCEDTTEGGTGSTQPWQGSLTGSGSAQRTGTAGRGGLGLGSSWGRSWLFLSRPGPFPQPPTPQPSPGLRAQEPRGGQKVSSWRWCLLLPPLIPHTTPGASGRRGGGPHEILSPCLAIPADRKKPPVRPPPRACASKLPAPASSALSPVVFVVAAVSQGTDGLVVTLHPQRGVGAMTQPSCPLQQSGVGTSTTPRPGGDPGPPAPPPPAPLPSG